MSWLAGLEHVVRTDVPLAPWTWLRIGGPAEFFAEPNSMDELVRLMQGASRSEVPIRFLGSGSNLLIGDQGVSGLVIHLSAAEFSEVKVQGNEILVGTGAKLNHLVSTATGQGLAGLESLVGIPGTVGGAVRNNTSGHGAAIGQWVKSVRALKMSGDPIELAGDELRFTYRNSNLDDLLLVQVSLELERGDTNVITRQMQKLWILNRAAQPTGELGHCQVFIDPRGTTAAEVIEQAGAKFLRVGGASLNERDPNYIEVQPGTSSGEVQQLIADVRNAASETLGVELVTGLKVW